MVTGRGLHSLFAGMFYMPKVKLAEICVYIIYKLVFQFKICEVNINQVLALFQLVV